MQRFGDGRDWFFKKRFGMFVHWGLYAIPAWHEQIQWRKGIARRDYEPLIRQFNPTRYNPEAWLDLAERTGMEYICLTTKHHDGFCLWNTAQTDFNVMRSPYGRDIVLLLAEACHKRGLPLGLYYSAVDWHHPNYPNQNRSHELAGPEPGDAPNLCKYLEFLKAQVRELCTQYGKLGAFWWDMNVTGHKDPSINAMIRELQSDAVINGRGFDEGDFGTPERHWDNIEGDLEFTRPTESCNSIGSLSWGYKRDDDAYADRCLMEGIVNSLARGGNFLLNVGPKADGTIPAEQVAVLGRIGRWYKAVRPAFDGTAPASALIKNRDVLLTRKGQTLYAHLVKPPQTSAVLLKPLAVPPRSAVLLNTGRPVEFLVDQIPYLHPDTKPYLRLRNLPVNELAGEVPVVKLEFDAVPDLVS